MTLARLALAALLFTSASVWANDWVPCAREGGNCVVYGTATVKYGAAGKFASKRVSGGVACSAGVFGDPAPGVHKTCYVAVRGGESAFREPPNWVLCAQDDGVCRFNGVSRVSYGKGKQWAYAVSRGGFRCSPQVFGRDPAPGIIKGCYYDSNNTGSGAGAAAAGAGNTAAPRWVKCATDDGVCQMSGQRRVSYGQGKNWVYRVANGNFRCSPQTFGRDPAPGIVKSCYYDANN